MSGESTRPITDRQQLGGAASIGAPATAHWPRRCWPRSWYREISVTNHADRGGAGAGRGPACCSNRCVLQHCSTATAAPCTQHCTAPHCSLVSGVSVCIDVSRHRPTLAVSPTEGCVQGSAGCSSSSVPTFEAATTHQPRQPRPGHHSKLGQGHQLMRTR